MPVVDHLTLPDFVTPDSTTWTLNDLPVRGMDFSSVNVGDLAVLLVNVTQSEYFHQPGKFIKNNNILFSNCVSSLFHN